MSDHSGAGDEDDDDVPLYVGSRPVSSRGVAPADMDDELQRRVAAHSERLALAELSARESAAEYQRGAAMAHAEAAVADRRGVVPLDGKGAGTSAPSSAARQRRAGDRTDASRIAALEEEVRSLRNTVRHQEKGLQQAALESEKQRKIIAGLTAKLDREQAEKRTLQNDLKLSEAVAATHKKEAAAAVRTQSKAGGSGAAPDAALELRLKRALEELESTRAQLATATQQRQQGEGADSGQPRSRRDEVGELTVKVNDLLQVVRRQNKMIDILKRQKLHLEAAKLLQFTEQEFAKLVETNES